MVAHDPLVDGSGVVFGAFGCWRAPEGLRLGRFLLCSGGEPGERHSRTAIGQIGHWLGGWDAQSDGEEEGWVWKNSGVGREYGWEWDAEAGRKQSVRVWGWDGRCGHDARGMKAVDLATPASLPTK